MDLGPDLRTSAVIALGGKCSKCGWAEDQSLLQVIDKTGNSTKEYKGRSREQYFLKLVKEPDLVRYTVLCPTCKQVHMKARRSQQAAAEAMAKTLSEPVKVDPNTLPVFVWSCTHGAEMLRISHKWIDKKVAEGHEAYIWLTDERRTVDGAVYRYRHPESPIAQNWPEFVRLVGLDPTVPNEATQLIPRLPA